jgi:hypothetical protein
LIRKAACILGIGGDIRGTFLRQWDVGQEVYTVLRGNLLVFDGCWFHQLINFSGRGIE